MSRITRAMRRNHEVVLAVSDEAFEAHLTPAAQDPDYHWWVYGNYNGASCLNCGRERVMVCEDLQGRERIICEKCDWDQQANDYRTCAEP